MVNRSVKVNLDTNEIIDLKFIYSWYANIHDMKKN